MLCVSDGSKSAFLYPNENISDKERKKSKNGIFIGQMKIPKKQQSEYFERTNASLLQRETK
jgi:hypothetical protein